MVLILWAVAAFLYNMMELIVKNQTLNDFLQQKELLYPGLDMAAK